MTDEQSRSTEQRLTDLEQTTAEIVDTLMGKEEPLTGVREGGMKQQLDVVYDKVSNGGVKIRLPAALWVVILAAVIAGVFQVVAALL